MRPELRLVVARAGSGDLRTWARLLMLPPFSSVSWQSVSVSLGFPARKWGHIYLKGFRKRCNEMMP